MKCDHPNCPRSHAAGYRILRTAAGWRCVEHAPPNARRTPSLHRPLTRGEAERAQSIEDNKL